jgi:hypothetical protein
MAISIDTIYQRVLAIANKEQRGYITPQEFNLMANQAQLSIFESYFYDKNARDRIDPEINKPPLAEIEDISELISKKLDPFTTIETVTGGDTYPSNYQTGKIYYNGRECQKVDKNYLTIFHNQAISKRHSAYAGSSVIDPVYMECIQSNRDIEVYQGTITKKTSNVSCEVVNKPAAVAWGYVVVNEQALYNSNTSTDFTLHDAEEDSLVFKILELAGIIINKSGLVQIAAQKEQVESQKQKQ